MAQELTERLEILLTKQEKQALKRLAEKTGVSMGGALRSALRTAAKRKKCY